LTVEEKRRELIRYRLRQAEESLEEAAFLLSGSKSPRSIINRAYYAMFYAVLALLVNEPYASSKHTGILTYFNKHFIKGGLLPIALGRALNKAFELRQRSDYREYVEPTREQVVPLIEESEAFIVTVKDYLAKRQIGL
jgi:uncharacterized protein (UPF0332 family)